MIPVAMRQHHSADFPEIDAEPDHVTLKHPFLRPGVEQKRAAGGPGSGGDQAGKPMRGAAQAFPGQPSHPATAMGGELSLDETGVRRKAVGRVIDEKDDLCRIDRFHGSSPF
jgi:hypothetical protein